MKQKTSANSLQKAKPLNSHQKRLLAELQEIAALTKLDYASIMDYPPDERTTRLKFMTNQLIRSQVIMDYAIIDEMLGSAICNYFFGKKRGFIKLWIVWRASMLSFRRESQASRQIRKGQSKKRPKSSTSDK
jgi:hypothetical protein